MNNVAIYKEIKIPKGYLEQFMDSIQISLNISLEWLDSLY